MIRLRVLGPIELLDSSGRELKAVLAQPKRLALLVYLAANEPGFTRRDSVVAMFWPELDQTHGRAALNQAVRFLRRQLGGSPESIVLSRGAEELGIDAGALWCDAAAFRAEMAGGRYGDALELYRGDLLPGFFAERSAGFEEWLERERSLLRAAAAKAAHAVAEAREGEHNFTTAIAAARRAVDLSGADERAVRALLELLDRLGDRAGAVQAYEAFAQRLARELDASPAVETVALMDRIRARAVVPVGPVASVSPTPPLPVSRPSLSPAVAVVPGVETSLTPIRELNGWRLEREIGRGGMSTVYLARDPKHDRRVALKLLRSELLLSGGAEQFLREIELTAQLAHPHILPLIDSGACDGMPYIVTPYVAGDSLRARLRREPGVAVADALRIATEIAEALDYAHRRGIVHRDIKPENILLADDHAVVADFGIATVVSSWSPQRRADEAESSAVVGTRRYMSPEQAAGEAEIDARSDIYSFGCVLFELLVGEAPGGGETAREIRRRRADIPAPVAALTSSCLARRASHRPASMTEVLRKLTSAGDGAWPVRALGNELRQALTMYSLGFGAVVAMTWMATVGIGLPEWVVPGAAILMALGLPVVLLTGVALHVSGDSTTATPIISRLPARVRTTFVDASAHLTWQRAATGGALAVTAFALLVAAFMLMRNLGIGPPGTLVAAGKLPERPRLLVSDFSVSTGDSALGGALSEAVRSSLSQSRAIRLMDRSEVSAALRRMRRPPGTRLDGVVARDIGAREGVTAIVEGTLASLGEGFIITLRLVTTNSGNVLASFQTTANNPSALIPAVDIAVRQLRAKIGEGLRTVRATPPLVRLTTSSIEALRLYTDGTRANNEGRFNEWIDYLRQAVAIDSEFATGWRSLAIAMANAGFPSSSQDSAIVKAYQVRDRLTEAERYELEGFYFSNGPHADRRRAIVAYERLYEAGEADPEGCVFNCTATALNQLGLVYQKRREWAKAESLFSLAASRPEASAFLFRNAPVSLFAQGKLDEAERYIAAGLKRYPSNTLLIIDENRLLYHRGELRAFERAHENLRTSSDLNLRRMAVQTSAAFAQLRGRLGLSEQRRRETAAIDSTAQRARVKLNDSIHLASLDAWFRRRPERAVRRLDAAVSLLPMREISPRDRPYAFLATAYARAGRPDKARAVLTQMTDDIRDTALIRLTGPAVHGARAEIALAEQQPRVALAEFRQADLFPDGPIDENPVRVLAHLGRAFDLANEVDSAITMFEQYIQTPYWYRLETDALHLPRIYERLGELWESKGDRTKAASYYRRFVDLWDRADPDLQTSVVRARQRLSALTRDKSR